MTSVEEREFTYRDGTSEIGRKTIFITCPFCGTETMAYVWSMSAVGKRCSTCAALHLYSGVSKRKKTKGS